MPQQRYPYNTTSVSGIAGKDWADFHARAKRDGLSNKEAIERAIQDLVQAVARNETIVWRPAKSGKARSIKIHDDYLQQVHALSNQFDHRLNVIIGTAIHRWTIRS